jgi:glycosyltransferase involved in cell wall biosynthesis
VRAGCALLLPGTQYSAIERSRIPYSKDSISGLRRPTIGVLANIYEADAGIRAGGHLHFIEVVKRWTDVDIVLFAPEIARADLAAALPHARFVAMPALPYGAPKVFDFLFRSIFSFRRRRELRRCDALLATSQLLVDVAPILFAQRPAAVISHHLIGSELGRNARANFIPVLSERIGLWATRFGDIRAFITSSNLVAGELRAAGLKMPIVVSTNGVDHIATTRAADASSTHRSGAVFVGRLHPLKNVDDAIRAWRIVVDRFPLEHLTIIGSQTTSSYYEMLRNLITELRLGQHVTLAGALLDSEKSEALARAKLFLFPSGEEGWGIALAEAMSAGLPCVTYDLPVFAEIFPVGRLEAPLGDHVGLADRVVQFLDDENLRLRYANDATELAKTFSWDRASQITASVFREMSLR